MCHHPGMGRHARGAAHLRVSVSTVVLGTLIVTVVAVGSLFSSHAQPTPIAAQGVESTAVVVSSLACQDGAGATQVDVLSPAGLPAGTTVRASLDGCGYQEGEQIAVQFAASDPTRVTLLGNPVDETATAGRLLPYGLMLAALLAAGAAAAVFLDARRSRRARAVPQVVDLESGRSESGTADTGSADGGSADAGSSVADSSVADSSVADSSGAGSSAAGDNTWSSFAVGSVGETMLLPATDSAGRGDAVRPAGRHARPDPDRGDRRSTRDSPSSLLVLTSQDPGAAIESGDPGRQQGSGDWELSSVDLSFPFTASLADSLHDELFTHRTVWS